MTLTLLTIAAILVVIDLFLASDIATHIAYVIMAYVLGTLFELDLMLQILIGLTAWIVVVLLHYLIFRKVIERFNQRFVTPDKFPSGEERLLHRSGTIVDIGGRLMLRIDGDVIPFDTCKDSYPPTPGITATIIGIKDGTPVIVPDAPL